MSSAPAPGGSPGAPGAHRNPRRAGPADVARGGRRLMMVAGLAWLLLWHLTPGLRANGIGSQFTDDPSMEVLIECGVVLVVLAVLGATHRRYTRGLFARSRLMWLYA